MPRKDRKQNDIRMPLDWMDLARLPLIQQQLGSKGSISSIAIQSPTYLGIHQSNSPPRTEISFSERKHAWTYPDRLESRPRQAGQGPAISARKDLVGSTLQQPY